MCGEMSLAVERFGSSEEEDDDSGERRSSSVISWARMSWIVRRGRGEMRGVVVGWVVERGKRRCVEYVRWEGRVDNY